MTRGLATRELKSVFLALVRCPFRAEGLKESQSKSIQAQTPDRTGPSGAKGSVGGSGGPVRQFFPLGPDFSIHDRPQPIRAVQSSEPQGQRYTSEEIEVLRWALVQGATSCYFQ